MSLAVLESHKEAIQTETFHGQNLKRRTVRHDNKGFKRLFYGIIIVSIALITVSAIFG